MEVHRLTREFLYNGVKLPDTTPTITPEQVRDTYTHLYPEIATAAIEGLKRSAANWSTSLFVRSGRKGETQKGCSPRRRQHSRVNYLLLLARIDRAFSATAALVDEPSLARDGTVPLAGWLLRELLARADHSSSAPTPQ
jgi:PRTRC genetic system protein C